MNFKKWSWTRNIKTNAPQFHLCHLDLMVWLLLHSQQFCFLYLRSFIEGHVVWSCFMITPWMWIFDDSFMMITITHWRSLLYDQCVMITSTLCDNFLEIAFWRPLLGYHFLKITSWRSLLENHFLKITSWWQPGACPLAIVTTSRSLIDIIVSWQCFIVMWQVFMTLCCWATHYDFVIVLKMSCVCRVKCHW